MSQFPENPRTESQKCSGTTECKNANEESEKVAEMDFEKWDFWKIVFCPDHALEFAPACHCFKIPKADYLAMQGD